MRKLLQIILLKKVFVLYNCKIGFYYFDINVSLKRVQSLVSDTKLERFNILQACLLWVYMRYRIKDVRIKYYDFIKKDPGKNVLDNFVGVIKLNKD